MPIYKIVETNISGIAEDAVVELHISDKPKVEKDANLRLTVLGTVPRPRGVGLAALQLAAIEQALSVLAALQAELIDELHRP